MGGLLLCRSPAAASSYPCWNQESCNNINKDTSTDGQWGCQHEKRGIGVTRMNRQVTEIPEQMEQRHQNRWEMEAPKQMDRQGRSARTDWRQTSDRTQAVQNKESQDRDTGMSGQHDGGGTMHRWDRDNRYDNGISIDWWDTEVPKYTEQQRHYNGVQGCLPPAPN